MKPLIRLLFSCGSSVMAEESLPAAQDGREGTVAFTIAAAFPSIFQEAGG